TRGPEPCFDRRTTYPAQPEVRAGGSAARGHTRGRLECRPDETLPRLTAVFQVFPEANSTATGYIPHCASCPMPLYNRVVHRTGLRDALPAKQARKRRDSPHGAHAHGEAGGRLPSTQLRALV